MNVKNEQYYNELRRRTRAEIAIELFTHNMYYSNEQQNN